MSNGAKACVMKLADAYFGCVPGGGCEKVKAGLREELERTAKEYDISALCNGDTDELTVIIDAAHMVKEAGIYPFYITKLAAAAVYAEAEEDDELAGFIAMGGVRSALDMLFEMDMEPELTFLITQAYAEILGDVFYEIDEKKLALMRTGYENGFYNEAAYHGCAQCTVKAYLDTVNLSGEAYDMVFRAASSLAGGGAICTDSACGGYSGANMIIGTLVGRTLDSLGKEGSSAGESHRLGQMVHDQFIATYGSVNCCDLHTEKFGRCYMLRDAGEAADFHNAGAHDVVCPTTVGMATAWLMEVLYDEGLIS